LLGGLPPHEASQLALVTPDLERAVVVHADPQRALLAGRVDMLGPGSVVVLGVVSRIELSVEMIATAGLMALIASSE